MDLFQSPCLTHERQSIQSSSWEEETTAWLCTNWWKEWPGETRDDSWLDRTILILLVTVPLQNLKGGIEQVQVNNESCLWLASYSCGTEHERWNSRFELTCPWREVAMLMRIVEAVEEVPSWNSEYHNPEPCGRIESRSRWIITSTKSVPLPWLFFSAELVFFNAFQVL
jgi:hypothetical protein